MPTKATIVVDLQFGDAGKGKTIDFLTSLLPTYKKLVIRFNGGSNAGHNVITPEGIHHTFSQIGSGFFNGADTLLSHHVLVDPIALVNEASNLAECDNVWSVRSILNRVFIDSKSPVITPFHIATNRIRELLRGNNLRHGSCGKGIWELASDLLHSPEDTIRVGDLDNSSKLESLLLNIQQRKRKVCTYLLGEWRRTEELEHQFSFLTDTTKIKDLVSAYKQISEALNVVTNVFELISGYDQLYFEGAQGVLLDETYGFYPYTTGSTVVPKNAISLLSEWNLLTKISLTTLGVMRTYTTRHGPGPFPTEHLFPKLPADNHNCYNEWQQAFRTGCLDLELLNYAIKCVEKFVPLDSLAVTHLDTISKLEQIPYCGIYNISPNFNVENPTIRTQQLLTKNFTTIRPIVSFTNGSSDFLKVIQETTSKTISIRSVGPTNRENLL